MMLFYVVDPVFSEVRLLQQGGPLYHGLHWLSAAAMSLSKGDNVINYLLIHLEKLLDGVVLKSDKYLYFVLDLLFPQQIIRQLLIVSIMQALFILLSSTTQFTSRIALLISRVKREQRRLELLLGQSETYEEWQAIAEQLDASYGLSKWRDNEKSSLCDCDILKRRIRDLQEMLYHKDYFNLIFRLRGGLARDQYGIQNKGLFTGARSGTLRLIEKYNATVTQALDTICDLKSVDEIPTDARLAFFNETRHSYGRTALLLSGGAYLGYYHMGVSRALWLEKLLPRVISGASAGSLMAALIGTRNDSELDEMFLYNDTNNFRLDYFRHGTHLDSKIARKLESLLPQSWRHIGNRILSLIFDGKIFNLDTEHFRRAVIDTVGSYTFQEAFDRTGRIINITVAPRNNYDPPRLLNYLTAPHVCVWSAAVASCALPGVFDSSPLIVKESSGIFRPEHEWTRQGALDGEAGMVQSYTDGSLESDLPMQQLSELFNVNHFVISQVNPHSAILSSLSLAATTTNLSPVLRMFVGYVRFLKSTLRDWLRNIVTLITFPSGANAWGAKRGFFQTLTQDYEGRENDVTIMPWIGDVNALTAFASILKNPTEEEYRRVVAVAERNTWPFMAQIKAHCSVEVALDGNVQKLRKKISEENNTMHESKLDRTPSFYTSRSIINLSGLSVSDPAPIARFNTNSSLAKKHLAGSEDSGLSGDYNCISEDAFDADLEAALSLSVRAADAVLNIDGADGEEALGKGSSPSSRNTSEGSLKDLTIKRNGSSDKNCPEKAITKTTNMTNFYYKKSRSDEKLGPN